MTVINGARCLVVGSTGGIGVAMAGALIGRGGAVVGVGRSYATQPGVDAYSQADITTSEGREAIVSLVVENGGVDIVVVAAGAVGFGYLAELSDEQVAHIVDLDLIAPLQLVSKLLPHIHDSGCIVFITGAVVDGPVIGMSAYTAAKAGLSAAGAVLRRELRPRKIQVLDARPGHTETALSARSLFGSAPTMKPGMDPGAVAARICEAISNSETELPPPAFMGAAN
jgi:cyclic-di-GMP-binding biofilm dispersal mediator protein